MKKVLVTGASTGIGKATAVAFSAAGYEVYAAARSTDELVELLPKGIKPITFDLTDDASIRKAAEKVGRLDVLVNNAGYAMWGSLEETPLDDARRQFEVNLFGLARLTQLVLPAMRKQKSGRIINVGSIAGKFGMGLGSWYHASKYAVEGLSDSLALELKPFGIKVTVIEPGVIKTPLWDIGVSHIKESSGNGPYKAMAKKTSTSFSGMPTSRRASPPQKVARQIVKVAEKENPRLRYAVGSGAKPILYLRRVLPDKIFYTIFSTVA
jgi:NAD(P)-dependent dehydrogenase (short-subunit alcohol dehydrogenase family)